MLSAFLSAQLDFFPIDIDREDNVDVKACANQNRHFVTSLYINVTDIDLACGVIFGVNLRFSFAARFDRHGVFLRRKRHGIRIRCAPSNVIRAVKRNGNRLPDANMVLCSRQTDK